MLVVGAILREPLEYTLRFVNWYLEQGADQIHLYFDNPQDPAIAVLQGQDKIRCTPCTRVFWRQIGVRPNTRFTRRQNTAMQQVYDGLSEGWFLNVDGDELVYLEGRTLQEELARQPEHVNAVRIRSAEHVHCPDTPEFMQFRIAMPRWCCRAIYGDLASAMQKRQGLSGHWIGKSATRAGLENHTVRQHFLETSEEKALTDIVLGHQQGAYLLHFVEHGFDAWRAKLEWRLSSRGFRQAIVRLLKGALNSSEPELALRRIYDRMFVFDPAQLEILDRANARLAVDLKQNELFARHLSKEIDVTCLSQT